jgi:hypothetical protein
MNPDELTAEQQAQIDEANREMATHIIAVTTSLEIVLDAVIGCRTRAIEAGFSPMAAEVMATTFYQTMIARLFDPGQ